MARKSLRPHLNQIRAWVRQGRTDAWIAHQLEVTVRDIEQFKRQNELVSEGETVEGQTAPEFLEVDLRAEDDALIAAELEAAEVEAARAENGGEKHRERGDGEGDDGEGEGEGDGDGGPPARARRRGRRGGRRRSGARAATGPLEGTFDHGEEGYGLWLDPAVQDNPIYAEHWAGHRPISVTIEEDRIVIERAGEAE
jgi:hypothetical protein